MKLSYCTLNVNELTVAQNLSEQMGLGLMQFGFVAIYLSESFVRGFMTAAGLQILISVLKYIVGIKVPSYSGPLATINVSLIC